MQDIEKILEAAGEVVPYSDATACSDDLVATSVGAVEGLNEALKTLLRASLQAPATESKQEGKHLPPGSDGACC